MKLGLGTVQFGMNYGVSNRVGRTPEEEAARIMAAALGAGVRLFDTAPAYGESEAVVGRRLPPQADVRIVTKTMPGGEPGSLSESLKRLKRDRIYGCLVHRAGDLFDAEGPRRLAALQEAKAAGLVQKIGVSVYTAADIDRCLALFTPDIVQLPANVFDQRLLRSGHVADLKRKGVEIHVRSVFLQGLVLMNAGDLPAGFERARGPVERFSAACVAAGCSKLSAALAFALREPMFDVVLVGVTSLGEWEEIVKATTDAQLDFGLLAVDDEDIVSPVNWRRAS